MRLVRGVMIDPFAKTMRATSIKKDVREIGRLIGVDLIEIFTPPQGGIELWVDEMGQLRPDPGWWMASWHQLLAGRCFVCRTGFRSLERPDHGYVARWIRPGMTESIAQLRHLNRARIITGAEEFRDWQRDEHDYRTMVAMLALATEPAVPVQ